MLPRSTLELRLRDLAYRALEHLAPSPPYPQIVLITLDQKSLQDFAQVGVFWPFPRTYYALIASFLDRSGARVLGIDLLLTDPSPYAGDDQAFRDTLLNLHLPVVLAAFHGQEGPEVEPLFRCPPRTPSPDLPTMGPLPLFQEGAAGVGNVAESPDPDGVFRRIRLRVRDRTGELPAFSAALWGVLTHASPCDLPDTLVLPPIGDPLRRYVRISFSEVVRWAFEGTPSPLFRDRVVILGTTAPGLRDVRPSPYASTTPGMALHAWALESLLRGAFLRHLPRNAERALWMLLPLLLLTVRYPFRRSTFRTLLLEAGLLVLGTGSLLAWLRWGLVDVSLLRLWVLQGTTLLVFQAWLYREEGRKRALIRKVLGLYLAPEVTRTLLANPDQLRLGGERRDITVFFCDVRGFSSLSEDLPPERLVDLINRYLDRVTRILFHHRATLDKYLGDGVMAFWGAPLTQPDHARRASHAALEIQQDMEIFRKELVRQGLPPIHIGIGLASGEAVVGNLGSSHHLDYTAVGDTVNIAARLEGLTRKLGVSILITETTRRLAGEGFFHRKVGRVRVKGKRQWVEVWELRSSPFPDPPLWHRALQALEQGEIREALKIFHHFADDPVANFYRKWIEEYPDEALRSKGILAFETK